MSFRRFSIGGGPTGGDSGSARPPHRSDAPAMMASYATTSTMQHGTPVRDDHRRSGSSMSSSSSSHLMESVAKRPRLMNTSSSSSLSSLFLGGGASSSTQSSAAGSSALDRYRIRQQQQRMLAERSVVDTNNHYGGGGGGGENATVSFSYFPEASSLSLFDHGGAAAAAFSSAASAAEENSAPSRLNAHSNPLPPHSSASASSSHRRMSLMPLSSNKPPKMELPKLSQYHQQQHSNRPDAGGGFAAAQKKARRLSIVDVPTSGTQHTLSQLTTDEITRGGGNGGGGGACDDDDDAEPDPATTSSDAMGSERVEVAALQSQVREMKMRIEQLEKEKLDLTCLNAPLQARFREKEDSWIKEQGRLMQENESLRAAACDVDERLRDLQVQYDASEAEVRRLRLDIRKASSSVNNNAQATGHGDNWSRVVQNDREVAELQKKLKASAFELESARLEKVSVEKELHAVKIEMESIARTLEELQVAYDEVSASTSDNRDAEIQLQVLTTEHIATAAQLNAVLSELAATNARAKANLDAKNDAIDKLQFEMTVLKSRAAKADHSRTLSDNVEDEAVLQARIEERDKRIAELEAEVLRGEQLRRELHNRIQELRGNIRVFVRTRPFLPNDKQTMNSAIDVSDDGETLAILDSRMNERHAFKFDKVFAPATGQEDVFGEVSDFVQSALDGYQVCLFSYGQTGSGKTHTMQGSGSGVMRGIIPRAVEQILLQAAVMRKQRWEFKLSASFLEIYNEELKDLLSQNSKQTPKLAIKRDINGKSYVDGLVEASIETGDIEEGMAKLKSLMQIAAQARSVASTDMNAHSSRSHSVFKLHISGHNHETNTKVQGSLNLCDLAGSERLDRSGASNDVKRLKETQAINKSLSALGDVFSALAQKSRHIPYRNSKLTYLLQDCLSGDGKALMFVNLSPTSASSSESLCSLRFAQRVNQVELGKPTKSIQYSH